MHGEMMKIKKNCPVMFVAGHVQRQTQCYVKVLHVQKNSSACLVCGLGSSSYSH